MVIKDDVLRVMYTCLSFGKNVKTKEILSIAGYGWKLINGMCVLDQT